MTWAQWSRASRPKLEAALRDMLENRMLSAPEDVDGPVGPNDLVGIGDLICGLAWEHVDEIIALARNPHEATRIFIGVLPIEIRARPELIRPATQIFVETMKARFDIMLVI
jgi:hypothetical protein